EDGIRDFHVTGVQTCALPISITKRAFPEAPQSPARRKTSPEMKKHVLIIGAGGVAQVVAHKCAQNNDVLGDIHIASRTLAKCERSEERRVGKEGRSRWSRQHQ